MPVNQISGIHLQAAAVPGAADLHHGQGLHRPDHPLQAVPGVFDQTIEHMRTGMAAGLMPPKFLLEKVVAQSEGIAAMEAEKSPFAAPLAKFPKEIPEAEQARLREQMLAAIQGSVLPAYARFAKFVKEEYAPKGRAEPGMWSLPDGEARYAWRVKQSTTTDLTPEQIHQLGLSEVTRIEGEMLVIAKKLGYSDLKSLNAAIAKDPKLHAHSRQQILDLYKGYIDQMYTKLPQLFGRLPKAKVEVEPTEAFREKEASSAEYQQGSPDGSRPGRVQVNTYEPETRKIISMRVDRLSRGGPRPSHADLDRPGAADTAAVPPAGGLHAPSSRAGRSTRSGSARRSASTRTPTATTATCRTRCCAPSAWWSTPASTTSTGPATRW